MCAHLYDPGNNWTEIWNTFRKIAFFAFSGERQISKNGMFPGVCQKNPDPCDIHYQARSHFLISTIHHKFCRIVGFVSNINNPGHSVDRRRDEHWTNFSCTGRPKIEIVESSLWQGKQKVS
jgi:hypothetical protein